MSTFTAEHCEQVTAAALDALWHQFDRAAHDTSDRGHVCVALGRYLYIDQVRGIATSIADGDDTWTRRDGRRLLRTATEAQQGALTLFVGGNRFLSAEVVFLVLCDLLAGKPVRATESNVAAFVNLLVVEPHLHPDRELPIWLAIAHKLATGRVGDDLHHELPELGTDFDVLHAELPDTGRYVHALRPHARSASPAGHRMRLFGAALPALGPTIAGAATDGERDRLFEAHTGELRRYVRAQVFARVAAAVNAAGRAYAWVR